MTSIEPVTSKRSRSKPGTILIVEDDPLSRAGLQTLLEDEGFEVLLAEDGAEGVELARDLHPDLVFLDLVLPNLNGFDAASILKADEDTAEIPIVAVTASWLGDTERLLGAGFAGAIRKPFGTDELLETVDRIIQS